MLTERQQELMDTARDHFTKGHYRLAEPLLMQLHTDGAQSPEIPYMLATITFDRGHLKKAIQLFKTSLEIDPEFTDSSVGLSIILNDLGKYDEAKKVFESAYSAMKRKQRGGEDSNLKEKLARKHAELGDMYFLANMFADASEQFKKATELVPSISEFSRRLGECSLKLNNETQAISAFENSLTSDYKVDTHLKLVEAYQLSGQNDRALFELDKMQMKNGQLPEIESWRQRLNDLNL